MPGGMASCTSSIATIGTPSLRGYILKLGTFVAQLASAAELLDQPACDSHWSKDGIATIHAMPLATDLLTAYDRMGRA
jgi:hypothetical protein